MAVSVGIDLGTTFSVVAWVDPATGQPAIITNSEGGRITPSVIQFRDDEVVVGSEAASAFAAGEPGCAATFKRTMGSREASFYVDDKAYTSEDLSAILLRHLKEEAEATLGDTIKDAVITVPAYFYDLPREATLRAAERAGLRVKKLIDEPNAAAMAYGLGNWRENANILVYDLGGGTFDVTLVRMGRNGVLSTITTRGDHALGGRDWDSRIVQLLRTKYADEAGVDVDDASTVTPILRGMVEQVKIRLSVMETVKAAATFPGHGLAEVTLTRAEFEESCADLLELTGSLCRAVLDEAGLTTRQVTDVLLVGGSTRMPQVSRFLEALIGKKPIKHVNPDEAVAIGAAIQATKEADTYAALSVRVDAGGLKVTDRDASLTSAAAVRPSKRLGDIGLLTLRETTAHAMGVASIDDETGRYYNEIIIPANHPRPVRAAKRFRFFTSPASANELEIYMLQGASASPLDCVIPHRYVVTGIQHVNRGERIGTVIRVQYSYDTNGIIRVQVRQENGTRDLPIRTEAVPEDMSFLARPAGYQPSGLPSSAGLTTGGGTHKDVTHKYRAITFSNAEWVKYDNITNHPSDAAFNEPTVHVSANDKDIEFHGYNVSEMDEGVIYTIDASDDFGIECDINTSTISPHPGGNVLISLGIITASLNEHGGAILLNGATVATVGSRFKLRMSLTGGQHYEIYIDGRLVGEQDHPTMGGVDVRFGLTHGSHYCELLSHAYVSDITMQQRSNQDTDDDDPNVETWED